MVQGRRLILSGLGDRVGMKLQWESFLDLPGPLVVMRPDCLSHRSCLFSAGYKHGDPEGKRLFLGISFQTHTIGSWRSLSG